MRAGGVGVGGRVGGGDVCAWYKATRAAKLNDSALRWYHGLGNLQGKQCKMKLYPSETWRPSRRGALGGRGLGDENDQPSPREQTPKKPTPGVSLDLAEELNRQESPRLPSKPTHPGLEPLLSFFFQRKGGGREGAPAMDPSGTGLSQTICIRITPRQRRTLQLDFHLVLLYI